MQKVYIISDTHFSHKNIIEYENRPFRDVNEMDNYMIEKWNQVVGNDDLIFHLGDVSFAGAKKTEKILNQLNGRKILIIGNHDKRTKTKWRSLGFEPYDRYIYQDYLLTHIPVDEEPLKVAVENKFLKGNVHGHTHSDNQNLDINYYRCCCVELLGYQPVLFDDFIREWEHDSIVHYVRRALK